jgi:hypothetical protein
MGRIIVPPDMIVRMMRARAERITGSLTQREVIARALIEAWTEGVNAGFDADDCMHQIGVTR